MCTIIVTIRTVLWAVMTIAGSLMILVSLFTNRWLIGGSRNNVANNIGFDNLGFGVDDRISVGIFLTMGSCVMTPPIQQIFLL